MALVDYNLRYELPFKDIDGNQWRVRIYDRDTAGAVERLYGTGNPVSIYYEGDEEFKKGIIGSSCSIRLLGVPNIEGGKSDLTQFFVSDEEKFYVKVEYTINGTDYLTYWTGFLYQDEYIERITADPYEVELVALDRLGNIESPANNFYNSDSEPTLIDIVNNFVAETKLELVVDEDTGLKTEFGYTSSFLSEQKMSAEAFLLQDDLVGMIGIREAFESILLSLNCTAYQQEGKLFIRPNRKKFSVINPKSIPDDLTQKGDNLYSRQKSPKKTVALAIGIGSKNLFENGSFERDAEGSTTVTGWSKPVENTLASIEIDDFLADQGSLLSLKTTNNRISDSTFDSASEATKLTTYTLLTTTSDPIFSATEPPASPVRGSGLTRAKIRLRVLINNTNDESPYEFRFSARLSGSTKNGEYYDFLNREFSAGFKYSFIDLNSNGDWQDIELDFPVISRTSRWDSTLAGASLVFNIHTMNYSEALSNVEVFYDNISFRLYTQNNIREYVSEDSSFYNILGEESESIKTDQSSLEIPFGITSFRSFPDITFRILDAVNSKVLGQYVNTTTGFAEEVSFFLDPITDDFRSLAEWNLENRSQLETTARKVFIGTVGTKRVTAGAWQPLKFGDFFKVGLSSYESDICRFTRFSFDVKPNEYNIDAITVP